MKGFKRLLFWLVLLPYGVFSQAIDNALSYKTIGSKGYVRLNYENDFFSATDIYYTQGINLEWVSPVIHRFPLTKLLIVPFKTNTQYGIGIEHAGYTPTSISHDEVLLNDRPFTATLQLKTFSISVDTVAKRRFSSTLSTGVIGQAAGGMEMQTSIHRWLHNITPHGWPNQIHNDLALNYQIDYEQQLIRAGKVFSLDGDAIARIGTLSDKISVGSTVMVGYFDSPYGAKNHYKRKVNIYLYDHFQGDAIGYDATMNGGLFNHSSPYTLPAGAINRFVIENRAGFVIAWQNIYLEYFRTQITREFKNGMPHEWGGVQVVVGF